MIDVSVCIPTYNRLPWLKEAVNSVFEQNGVSFELLILNNGCTDNDETRIYLSELEDRSANVEVITSLVNRQETNMYEYTSGEFVTMLCDDDLLADSSSLARRVKALRENPDAGFVFSSVLGHSENGEQLGRLSMGNFGEKDSYFTSETFFPKMFTECHVPFPSGMWRRDPFCNLINEEPVCRMGCSMDWGMWTKMLHSGAGAVYLAESTVSLRQHSGQDSYARGIAQGGFIKAALIQWDYYIKNGHKPSDQDWVRMNQIISSLQWQQNELSKLANNNALGQLYEESLRVK